ncbi:MAG: restriction endonuclease subunit S [Bacteroidales bacterium]|nr:restriction endonuclease subunit S [Bacteroidales bacterium]MCF8403932.1 restriction endonuclease subunit S [Bacteroidales bacterium]
MNKEVKHKLPELRFPEFNEKLKYQRLNQIASIKRGAGSQYIQYTINEENGTRLIRIGDFLGNEPVFVEETEAISRFKIKEGDILMAGTGATAGITFQVPKNFDGLLFSYNAPRIRVKNGYPGYIISYLKSENVIRQQRKLFTGLAQHFLDTKAIGNLKLFLPSLPEQQKIASFLSAVDERIRQLTRKKELLDQYKKGEMQKLFKQEIRFKREDGSDYPEWKRKRLGDLTFKVGKKNTKNIQYPIYSINNQQGFLPQNEQFEGLDSNNRGYDISMYKIIYPKTFAYNPARINVGSIGYSYDLNEVIISSLYVCFKTRSELDDLYLLAYISGYNFNKDVLRYQEGGVRQYLFYENFSHIKIPLPSIQEQKKIVSFLASIDKKTEQVSLQLLKTRAFKKGLLQQMFG